MELLTHKMKKAMAIAIFPLFLFVNGTVYVLIALAIQLAAALVLLFYHIKNKNDMDRIEKFNELLKGHEFTQWYDDRPENIKKLIQQYPFEVYRMKAGSPYKVNIPGTLVYVRSLRESGEMTVVVFPEDLLPQAKVHIKDVMTESNTLHNYDEAINTPVTLLIDPIYLEELTQEEYDKILQSKKALR